jgi:WD40 repeat protein
VVRVWDADTGRQALVVPGQFVAHGVAFSPNGQRLAIASEDGKVRVLDGTPLQEPERGTAP